MKQRVVIRPAAHADLLDHYVFIGLDSPRMAERFMLAAQDTFQVLAEMPDIGTRWLSDHAALQDVRYYHVEDFPNHLVFYRKVADAVEVLHVFHGARNIDDLLTPEG